MTNEKYKGDCLLQKTYLADFLSPKRVKNEGQAQQYYVEDSHVGIVSKEIFDCVQQEMSKRKEIRSASNTGNGRYSGKYVFSGRIICGECGETYRRHQQYTKKKKYYIWTCKRHENQGNKYCTAKPIKEDSLKKGFVRALNRLIDDKEEILKMIKNETCLAISDDTIGKLQCIEDKIQIAQNAIMQKITCRQSGDLNDEEYEKETKSLMKEIDSLNLTREEILSEQGKMRLVEYRKEEICRLMDTAELLNEFDEIIFKSLVKEIKVLANKEIEIVFECGVTVRENV